MKEFVRILVADDESMMRNVLLKLLESEGYKVTVVASGDEAIKKLQTGKYDLLLTDARMPGLSGDDLLKSVKTRWPNTAVIIMTGHGDVISVKKALLLGADDYLSKPFHSQEVSLIVERACWRLLSSRDADEQKKPLASKNKT